MRQDKKLSDIETKTVVKTLADRLAKNRGRDSEREMRKCTPRNYLTRYPTYLQQLKTTNFWKTVRDVQVKALVITMHYSLAQAQLQIPGETLRDVETDASADTLPDTLAELKCKKVGQTVTDVKITDVETKTVGKILGNVEVEALADTSPDTLSQVVAKTIANTLTCVEAKAPVKNRR